MTDKELIYRDEARAAVLKAEPRAAYCIDRVKSVDAAPVVHGWWMEFNSFMTCSVCDTDWYYADNNCDMFDYCPNCGAKMDGERKDNERKAD